MNYLIVAGFDFGTSYSKVVLQDQLTKKQKVVTFGDDYGALFPSCVYIGDEWISGPEEYYEEGELVSYPKLLAADAATGSSDFHYFTSNIDSEALEKVGATDAEHFAKLVLARYFLSILNAVHDFIRNDSDWSDFDPESDHPLVVQMAVPTGLMSDADKSVESLMRESLIAATHMFRSLGYEVEPYSYTSDLDEAFAGAMCCSLDERRVLAETCITYPEVAAGVQPILQARNVSDGKYITLDVGAGTIDLNAFHRYSRNEELKTINYWACQVDPLGISRLKPKANQTHRGEHEITVNPMATSTLMLKLEKSVQRLMSQAFKFQPLKTPGNGPSPWRGETFAYIWGGGSNHRGYEKRLQKVLMSYNIGVHTISRLPRPEGDMKIPKGVDFGRLAVAFGLSYYHVNLRQIKLPHDLDSYSDLYGSQNLVNGTNLRQKRGWENICSCGGQPACYRCLGTGFI